MPEIYLHLNEQQAGPYQLAQIQQLLKEGKISVETLAWHQGLTGWIPVGNILGSLAPGVSLPPPPPKKKGMSGCLIAAIIGGAIMVLLLPCCAGIALGPITNGIKKAKENMAMQKARAIEISMFQYANDHNGVYPDGTTSTEVFQKLIDGKYVSDPSLFYIEMPGKTKAVSSKLSAENVCFDVTSGAASDSSDDLPLVFCTGYKITYAAGAGAMRDEEVAAPFSDHLSPGLVVAYKDHSARFLKADVEGNISGFIPPQFISVAKTYRQLRP